MGSQWSWPFALVFIGAARFELSCYRRVRCPIHILTALALVHILTEVPASFALGLRLLLPLLSPSRVPRRLVGVARFGFRCSRCVGSPLHLLTGVPLVHILTERVWVYDRGSRRLPRRLALLPLSRRPLLARHLRRRRRFKLRCAPVHILTARPPVHYLTEFAWLRPVAGPSLALSALGATAAAVTAPCSPCGSASRCSTAMCSAVAGDRRWCTSPCCCSHCC